MMNDGEKEILNETVSEPELQLLFTSKPGMEVNRFSFKKKTNENAAVLFSTPNRGIRAQESRNFQILPTKVEHLTTDILLPE